VVRSAAVGLVPSHKLSLEILLFVGEFHSGILSVELHELFATLVGKRRA